MTSADSDLLSRRYGHEGPGEAPLSPVIACALKHRSVRRYVADEVPDEALRQMIAAAQSASTSSNLQSWSVIVVRDEERKQRLSTLAGDQSYIVRAPVFLVWIADLARPQRLAAAKGQVLGACAISNPSWWRRWMRQWPRKTRR